MIDFNTLSLASCFQSCFSMLNALPQLIGIKFSREEDSLKSPDVFFSYCCWNKLPQIVWLKTAPNVLSYSSGDQESDLGLNSAKSDAVFLSGVSMGRFISRLIQVVSRIQVLAVEGLMFSFLSCCPLSALSSFWWFSC